MYVYIYIYIYTFKRIHIYIYIYMLPAVPEAAAQPRLRRLLPAPLRQRRAAEQARHHVRPRANDNDTNYNIL